MISGNLVECKWFLKQVIEFGKNNPGIPGNFVNLTQGELDTLTGKDCFDAEEVEDILCSPRYALFHREQERICQIKQERQKIKEHNSLFCTCISSHANNSHPASLKNDYLSIQEARIALFWESQRGLNANPERIKELFVASLGYESHGTFEIPPNTLGLIWDPLLEVLFVYSSPFVLFRFPVKKSHFSPLLKRLHSICTLQNTETLRNTAQIAADPHLRAQWWQTRRELDSQLQLVAREIDELLFNGVVSSLVELSYLLCFSRLLFQMKGSQLKIA